MRILQPQHHPPNHYRFIQHTGDTHGAVRQLLYPTHQCLLETRPAIPCPHEIPQFRLHQRVQPVGSTSNILRTCPYRPYIPTADTPLSLSKRSPLRSATDVLLLLSQGNCLVEHSIHVPRGSLSPNFLPSCFITFSSPLPLGNRNVLGVS